MDEPLPAELNGYVNLLGPQGRVCRGPSSASQPTHKQQIRKPLRGNREAVAPHLSIGNGDYELIGRIELGLLLMEGLRPDSTLVDFGCGTGRLAVHVIPRLQRGGRYIGIDISETMLAPRGNLSVGEPLRPPPGSSSSIRRSPFSPSRTRAST